MRFEWESSIKMPSSVCVCVCVCESVHVGWFGVICKLIYCFVAIKGLSCLL